MYTFNHLVDHCVAQAYTMLNILKPKILASALEHQVSRGDTDGEAVDH